MKLSLRSLIAIPLLAQVVGVTTLTGWLAHRHGQKAIETLAYHLLDETGEHFHHKLETYTSIPPLVTQENLDKLELQQLDTNNLYNWVPHLLRQIQRFPDATYIYYGHADGRYAELNRLPDGSLEFAIKNDANDGAVQVSPVTADGQLQAPIPNPEYDPRLRPWYRIATKNQQASWTNIYDFEDPAPTLGISFVRPYLDDNNVFQGVLGADFTLAAIKTFLERVQTRHASAMFLMDTNGKVLANSTAPPLSPSNNLPLSANQQQTLIKTTINHVLNKINNGETLQSEQRFRFRAQNANYWVQITPFADSYGLRWLGISLLPETHFTDQIRANSRDTALLSLMVMTVSGGVSWIIVRWINRPIEQLGLATQSLAQGNASQSILPSKIQELNLLINNFNHMGDALQASQAQLYTYSQNLEDLVEQRTRALKQSEETFAKAFQASPNSITLSTVEDGRYIKVNDRFVELMGIPREDILGRTSTELSIWIAPQTREVFHQEVVNGKLRNQEWTVQNPLGEIKTVLLSAEIIHFKETDCILIIANDISERVAKQIQLRQSEERWQLALKGNNDGIWDWNIAANETFYSARWKEMLGYAEQEIRSDRQEWEKRLHPEDRERVLQANEAHLKQQSSFFAEEYRLRCKDGHYKWVLDRGQALWNTDGKAIRMVGSHTDISDRKYNEFIIQQQEQFLRSIYNGVEAGIFVVDVLGYQQFRYVDSNATLLRRSKTQRQALINATPEELFSPEIAIEVIHKYQHCVDRGNPLSFEEQLLIDEHLSWWLTKLTPLKNPQGKSYRIIGTTVNITDRKNVEEALAQQVQSEQLLTRIINEIRQSLDPQNTYQTAVDEIGLAFGVSRCCLYLYNDSPEPILETVAEYRIPDYRSIKDFSTTLSGNPHLQTIISQESALVTDDVSQAPLFKTNLMQWQQLQVKSILAVRTSYKGQPNGVIEIHQCDRQRPWISRDIELLESVAAQVGIAIAQAHLLEQEHIQQKELAHKNIALQTAIQVAEQASQVKSEFLASMSHELRTPLNAILGFAQVMQRSLKHNPTGFQQNAAKHLEIIQTSGDHLLTLINNILDVSKIEAGHISINAQPFEIAALLESLTAMFQVKAHEKGLLLRCKCALDVPQYVQTDEAKLRQILINLLGNAIKFTNSGSITLSVSGQNPLHIKVQDTGQGIASHQLEHLFETFYQADAGRQTQDGTGLGLAISKTYVELLGGQLSVQSSLGQGSTFLFDLPITAVETLTQDSSNPYPSVIRLAPSQPSYRILVVEDKWTSRTLLMQLLRSAGFEVREAANGQEAIRVWEEWQPQLIWMDMRMPVMDGYEATKQIRGSIQGQATAIIALTASALENEKQMVLSVGCDDFVRKPFRSSVIFDKIQQHLGVEYIHEEQQTIEVSKQSSNSQEQIHEIVFTGLSRHPQAWVNQLHQASSLADAEWVAQLINELPQSDAQLATALTKLARGFRCDLIAELSAKSITENLNL